MYLRRSIGLFNSLVSIAAIAIFAGIGQTPAMATIPPIAVSDVKMTGVNAGKDDVIVSGINTNDSWALKRTFRPNGATETGGVVLKTSDGLGSVRSVASGIGPEAYDEDGMGYAERITNTLQSLKVEFTPGTRYYQFWVQWSRSNLAGAQYTYGPVNWYGW